MKNEQIKNQVKKAVENSAFADFDVLTNAVLNVFFCEKLVNDEAEAYFYFSNLKKINDSLIVREIIHTKTNVRVDGRMQCVKIRVTSYCADSDNNDCLYRVKFSFK